MPDLQDLIDSGVIGESALGRVMARRPTMWDKYTPEINRKSGEVADIVGNTARIMGAPILNQAQRMQNAFERGIDWEDPEQVKQASGGTLLDMMGLVGGTAGAAERGTVGALGGKPSSGWFGEFLNKGASGNEKISAAAVRMKDGRVLTGPSHIDIVDNPHLNLDDLDGAIDGFVTSSGRFVDRNEAARIANHTGPMRFESSNMKRGQ